MARIAFALGSMFEDVEFRKPYDALKAAGHQITVVGKKKGEEVEGKRGKETFRVEAGPRDVDPRSFDALVIPGGYSPDQLRTDEEVVGFVRRMASEDKLIAAVCHAGSLLIEAGVVEGRRMTSWPSIRTDLINAGARWEDREVVEDGNFITSRKPDDLDAFVGAIRKRLE